MTEQTDQLDSPVTTDQTEFAAGEPLFESPPRLPGRENTHAAKEAWYRKPKVLLVGGVGLLGVLAMVATLLMQSSPATGPSLLEPSASPLPQALSQLEQRIIETRTQLQAADPTKQEFPFPPVDMELNISTLSAP